MTASRSPDAPLLSVIVPVHDRERLLPDAISSVLGQDFTDLELIVVDDGSTDGSVAIAEGFADRRLRLLRHPRNRGISAARNTGLEAARGRFIAWLDSDDVARPGRFAAQMRFLASHPEIALCGSAGGKIEADGRPRRGRRIPPLSEGACRGWLLFRPCAQQSSIVGRAEVLRAFPYTESLPVCEDYDVLARIVLAGHRIANLPQRLFDRRIHDGQIIRRRREAIREANMRVSASLLRRLGLVFDDHELALHFELGNMRYWGASPGEDELRRAAAWLGRIAEVNRRTGFCPPAGLALALGFFWLSACHAGRREAGRATALRLALSQPFLPGLAGAEGRRWLAARMF